MIDTEISITTRKDGEGDPQMGSLFRLLASDNVCLRVTAPPDVPTPKGCFFAVNLSSGRSYFYASSNTSHAEYIPLTQKSPLHLEEVQ